MNFEEYEKLARETAAYPGKTDLTTLNESKDYSLNALTYCALGLNGEAGEVAEKIKKLIRDHKGVITDEFRVSVLRELGDCTWYITSMANELGFTLQDVAIANIEKLHDRRARGVVHGSGDNR